MRLNRLHDSDSRVNVAATEGTGVVPLGWMTLNKYIEISGETSATVRHRRSKGVWTDQVHSKIGPNGRIWVNYEEVQRWLQGYAGK